MSESEFEIPLYCPACGLYLGRKNVQVRVESSEDGSEYHVTVVLTYPLCKYCISKKELKLLDKDEDDIRESIVEDLRRRLSRTE